MLAKRQMRIASLKKKKKRGRIATDEIYIPFNGRYKFWLSTPLNKLINKITNFRKTPDFNLHSLEHIKEKKGQTPTKNHGSTP